MLGMAEGLYLRSATPLSLFLRKLKTNLLPSPSLRLFLRKLKTTFLPPLLPSGCSSESSRPPSRSRY